MVTYTIHCLFSYAIPSYFVGEAVGVFFIKR